MAGHFDGTYSTRCEASLVEWTETQCSGPRCHACRPAVGRFDWELSLAPVERDWRMRPVVQSSRSALSIYEGAGQDIFPLICFVRAPGMDHPAAEAVPPRLLSPVTHHRSTSAGSAVTVVTA